jgi:hypothetical protein
MKNVCGKEKMLRIIAGSILLVLYLLNILTGTAGTIAAIIGGLLLLTGLIGYCPLNTLLGINSCKTKTAPSGPGISQMNQNPQANPPVDVKKANE